MRRDLAKYIIGESDGMRAGKNELLSGKDGVRMMAILQIELARQHFVHHEPESKPWAEYEWGRRPETDRDKIHAFEYADSVIDLLIGKKALKVHHVGIGWQENEHLLALTRTHSKCAERPSPSAGGG